MTFGASVGIFSTVIANICDRLTYDYVKENTFRGNKNQVGPTNHQNNIQAVENELSDHQKELLKIPLNAVRISLISILPLIFGLILVFVIGDNLILKGLVRINIALSMLCMLQGVRIVIVLTCLHKATEANQAEISQAKRRADRQEWERMNSFRAKRLRQQAQTIDTLSSEPQPSTSSASQDKEPLPSLRQQKQILDPDLLETIMEEETSF